MTNLVKYNNNCALNPNGFRNIGSFCHFNALLQCMISCTSFLDAISTIAKAGNKNLLIKSLDKFIKQSNTTQPNESRKLLEQESSFIFSSMITQLVKVKKINMDNFSSGEQCASEGFHFLLEALDDIKSLKKLFIHRYQTSIYCPKCNKWISKKECENYIFDIQHNLKIPQIKLFNKYDAAYNADTATFNDYLLKQNSYVDKNFKCSTKKCNETPIEKFTNTVLVRTPEVLVIMSKKYMGNEKIDIRSEFPEELKFNGINKEKMVYKAIAQIEHVGDANSGHYYSICKRKNGWYLFNDNTVKKVKGFEYTKNTFIVFYHIE
jgi:ubiquitin C-terminal hydrolase